ncbi:MAG TPA: phosphatidylserine decarboxylase family protein [Gemmatimonadaceae bacterium]|nr:phosphatidylserine decarboxylase family protein [Gemmatimonadaceae bacterium]
MSVAREGLPFIFGACAAAAAAVVLALVVRGVPAWTLAVVLTLLAAWVVYFFRDPERTGPRGDRLVIAPADGKVVLITTVDEPAFMGGKATRISIFMNVFSVHVNRYPVSGSVTYLKYTPGKFLHAGTEQASVENEQSAVGIDAPPRKVMVRQIAGAIARRIITYAALNERVVQGERMGLIRFGSRVDVYVPASAAVKVQIGDHPVAGTTVLAELP